MDRTPMAPSHAESEPPIACPNLVPPQHSPDGNAAPCSASAQTAAASPDCGQPSPPTSIAPAEWCRAEALRHQTHPKPVARGSLALQRFVLDTRFFSILLLGLSAEAEAG